MDVRLQSLRGKLGHTTAAVRLSVDEHRSMSRPMFALVCFYVVGVGLGVSLFVLGFLTNFFGFLGIFFYRGLVIITAAALVHAVIMAIALHRIGTDRLSPANLVSVVVLSAMLNLTFFTLIPVNLDRSISVFLLAWMGNSDNSPMTRADLQHVFQAVYVGRYQAIDRRISEQIASGNIKLTPNGYVLTQRGRIFNHFAKAVGVVFSVDPRFLNPHCVASEITSELTGCESDGLSGSAADNFAILPNLLRVQ